MTKFDLEQKIYFYKLGELNGTIHEANILACSIKNGKLFYSVIINNMNVLINQDEYYISDNNRRTAYYFYRDNNRIIKQLGIEVKEKYISMRNKYT